VTDDPEATEYVTHEAFDLVALRCARDLDGRLVAAAEELLLPTEHLTAYCLDRGVDPPAGRRGRSLSSDDRRRGRRRIERRIGQGESSFEARPAGRLVAEVHAALAYALENRERMETMSERRTHRPEAE
jgi:hypothetical protein